MDTIAVTQERIGIGILGPLSVTDADGRLLGGMSPKVTALIAYLALADGHRARRSRLAALLWSRGDAEHANASMRQLLRRLRENDVGEQPWLIADRDEVRLDWKRIDLDFAAVEAAVAAGDTEALQAAADRWRGSVLDGVDADSESFEDWLRSARAQLTARLTLGLHRRLAATAPADGAIDPLARLLLHIDPCDETAVAAAMRRDLELGRSVRALRVFSEAESAMARDLGVRPNAALRDLAERARRLSQQALGSSARPMLASGAATGVAVELGLRLPPGPAPAQEPALPPGPRWMRIDTETLVAPFDGPRAALEAALTVMRSYPTARSPGLAIWTTNCAAPNTAVALEAAAHCGNGRIVLDHRTYEDLSATIPALYIDQGEFVPGDPATRHFAIDLGDPALGVVTERLGRGSIRAAPALRPLRPVVAIAEFAWRGDPGDAGWAATALADCVAMTLAGGRWFDVVSAGGSAAMAGADYTISGELARSGDEVHMALRIVRSGDGRMLSAWRHRSTIQDLLTLDGEVVRQIVAVLEPNMIEAVWRSLEPAPVQATDAFHCIMRALQFGFRFSAADLEESVRLCDRAIAQAPDFAKGWACRALAAVLAIYMGWEPDPAARAKQGFADAQRAIALDAGDPWSRFALGMMYLSAGATAAAHVELARAIEINPGFAWAHGAMGQTLVFLDRLDDAVGALRLALRLSPRDPLKVYWLVALALAEFLAGHSDFALEWARLAAAERPDYPGAQRLLAVASKAAGNDAEAAAAFAAMRALQPDFDMAQLTQVSPFSNPDHLPTYAAALHGLGWGSSPAGAPA